MNMKLTIFTAGVALILPVTAALAVTVDLNTWTEESYPAVAGFDPGNWVVTPDGSSVTQTVNGQPTIFYSDFNAFNTTATGTVMVNSGGDDDYIGFVLGFNPGDTTIAGANYLLVDWKQSSQDFDFGVPSSSPGGTADVGLAVSRVSGIPDADEFWQHDDLAGTGPGNGLEELARGTTLGNTGWEVGTAYEFSFEFTDTMLRILVDGVEEIAIAGMFSNGRLGFYNFSQADVQYSSFTVDAIPLPSALPMLAIGLSFMGLVSWGKRRQGRPAA